MEEIDQKKQKIEETIKTAGKAYINRNAAEKKLEDLQEEASKQKQKF